VRSTGCVGAMLAADKLLLQSRIRQVCRLRRAAHAASACLAFVASSPLLCVALCVSQREQKARTSRVRCGADHSHTTQDPHLAKPTAAGRTFSVQKKVFLAWLSPCGIAFLHAFFPTTLSLSWAIHSHASDADQRNMACLMCWPTLQANAFRRA
jgi:hypothetical protein